MRTTLATLAIILALSAAAPALAATVNSQLSVGTDGIFVAKHLLVYQKSGSALYCRAVWGAAFVRLTVLVPNIATTTITKNHGGNATLDDIVAGDYLDVEGRLETGADALLVNATTITDSSANLEQKTAGGTIKSVSGGLVAITDKTLGAIVIDVGATTTITKGVRTISAGELMKGDKILSAAGTFDFNSKTLSAQSITVYQDMSVFAPRNFQGTVKSISGTALPATLTVSTMGADYQVNLAADASVLSKNKTPVGLSRFAVGDTVRFWGAVRQDNLATVDTSILRDLNF